MLRRSNFIKFLKNLVVITLFLLCVLWLEANIDYPVVSLSTNYINASLEIESGSSDHLPQLRVNHSFIPGVFNLMEDAARFNGTLQRPIKECSFGKFKVLFNCRCKLLTMSTLC